MQKRGPSSRHSFHRSGWRPCPVRPNFQRAGPTACGGPAADVLMKHHPYAHAHTHTHIHPPTPPRTHTRTHFKIHTHASSICHRASNWRLYANERPCRRARCASMPAKSMGRWMDAYVHKTLCCHVMPPPCDPPSPYEGALTAPLQTTLPALHAGHIMAC